MVIYPNELFKQNSSEELCFSDKWYSSSGSSAMLYFFTVHDNYISTKCKDIYMIA